MLTRTFCLSVAALTLHCLAEECNAQYHGRGQYNEQQYQSGSGYQYPSQMSYNNYRRPSHSGYGPRQFNGPNFYPQPSHTYRGQSTQTRQQTFNFEDHRNASQRHYYHWIHVPGTAATGYVAQDGSRWKLLKANGIISFDQIGRKQQLSTSAAANPHPFLWKIERPKQTGKRIWVARNSKTGSVSVLYRQPPPGIASRFHRATATMENGVRIVDVQWEQMPEWGRVVNLAKPQSLPRLPSSSFLTTSRQYIPATQNDVIMARRALSWNKPRRPPYE